MNNKNSADRRVFARIPIRLPIRFLASGRDKECPGQTIDISANGIGLLCKENLPPNTPVEMWLDLPETNSPFYTRGEVIWSDSPTIPAQQRIGVRLDKAELMGLAPVLWK